MSGDGSLCDGHNRTLSCASVIFGDDNNETRHHKPDETAEEKAPSFDRDPTVRRANGTETNREKGRDGQTRDRQEPGGDQAFVKSPHDRIVGPELHEISPGDGGDDASRADRERVEHGGLQHRLAGEENRGEHHGGDDRHNIGFEQIGGHAGAIADIVAHIIGDRRRIAGIILGNPGFDLADEIGADISPLGENAATKTGEDRDERGTETERDQRVDRLAAVRRMAERSGENVKIHGDAKQGEARDQKPGNRARLEGEVEPGGERLRRGLRGADIGAHRDIHADEPGRARQHRANQKSGGEGPGDQEPKGREDDETDGGDGYILAFQIGLRPFGDRPRDLLHFRRAGIGG